MVAFGGVFGWVLFAGEEAGMKRMVGVCLGQSGFELAMAVGDEPQEPPAFEAVQLPIIRAGWPEAVGVEGFSTSFDPGSVLRTKPTSFAFRVRGCSMVGANIQDGDIVIGEFTPAANPGAIVVALIDGESTLKRFVMRHGRPFLVSENPNQPDLSPLSELVIQGVVHTVVHPVR